LKIRRYLILVLLTSFPILISSYSLVQAETIRADFNNDGVQDLTAFFNADTLSRTELDRNGDGQVDVWMTFISQGKDWDTRADYDEDYDGQVDEVFFIKDDQPIRSFTDEDKDGLLDEEVDYKDGVPTGKKSLAPPLDPKKL